MKAILSTLLLLLVALPAPAATIESGYTGVWNNPARSGEGFTLEILDPDHASLAWFTFDDEGDPRWAYALGDIVRDAQGERIEFTDIYRSIGGAFGPAYSPDAVTSEWVGRASITFDDCNRGVFSFDAFGQALSVPVERLVRVMAAGCAPIHGRPGDVVQPYAGQTGIWSDPARFGQGFQLQWTTDNAAILGWYTFGPEGEPYWLTGVGLPDGEPTSDGRSRIVFDVMYAVRGARFGAAFDPADVELQDWGRVVLELECDHGTVHYESSVAGFGSGDRPIQLLTRAVPAACPWVKPKLTDLYDIEYTELPLPAPTPDTLSIRVTDLADDGTVVGFVPTDPTASIVSLRPDVGNWEALPGADMDYFAVISPDASTIISTRRIPIETSTPSLWRDSTGWQPFGNAGFERAIVFGASRDRTRVVGTGYFADNIAETPWIWSEETGQTVLPRGQETGAGTPTSASNDGRTVVGAATRFYGSVPRRVAVRWRDAGEPVALRDHLGQELGGLPLCNADCSLIFGGDQAEFDPDHPNEAQAWYWRAPGEMAYLGRFEDEFLPGWWPYAVLAVSADGSLAAGGYITSASSTEGFVWTQTTGLVSVRDLLLELNLQIAWRERVVQAVSSDGKSMLLRGSRSPQNGPSESQAAILRLTPKTSPDVFPQRQR